MANLDPTALSREMEKRIEASIPDSRAEVTAVSPGHFTIAVVSPAFEGLMMVKQQQMVYAAINDLIVGANAPVHAIDSMDLKTA